MAQQKPGVVPAGFQATAEQVLERRRRQQEQSRPEPPQDEEEGPTPEQAAQMRQLMEQSQNQAKASLGACVPCMNKHKLGLIALTKALNAQGIDAGNPAFKHALIGATMAGQQAVQQGLPLPDGALPPVRSADMLVSGTGVCAGCFQPNQNTSGLILGTVGMDVSKLVRPS